MKIVCRKLMGTLRPVDPVGEDALAKIKNNDLVMVEVKRARSIQHHRLYWALIGKVWENLDQEDYPTADDLSDAIKIAAGHRVRLAMPDGSVAYSAKSIAFAKMDQTEFAAFYERVCDVIAMHFLPGVTSAELRSEVEQMIGAAA